MGELGNGYRPIVFDEEATPLASSRHWPEVGFALISASYLLLLCKVVIESSTSSFNAAVTNRRFFESITAFRNTKLAPAIFLSTGENHEDQALDENNALTENDIPNESPTPLMNFQGLSDAQKFEMLKLMKNLESTDAQVDGDAEANGDAEDAWGQGGEGIEGQGGEGNEGEDVPGTENEGAEVAVQGASFGQFDMSQCYDALEKLKLVKQFEDADAEVDGDAEVHDVGQGAEDVNADVYADPYVDVRGSLEEDASQITPDDQDDGPKIIPIGTTCVTAMILRDMRVRKEAFPFDWLITTPEVVSYYFEKLLTSTNTDLEWDEFINDFLNVVDTVSNVRLAEVDPGRNYNPEDCLKGHHSMVLQHCWFPQLIFKHEQKDLLSGNVEAIHQKYKRRWKRLKQALLAKENRRIVLFMMTPHGESRWPTVSESNIQQLRKSVDHCEYLQKVRELIISSRKAALPTAGDEHSTKSNADQVSVITVEQDPDWMDDTYKDACNDVSKGMYFGSIGKQGKYQGGFPPQKNELLRLLDLVRENQMTQHGEDDGA
eukprot:gnl/MRDRNA2_/MRDRNA2_18191_c0_seq1.p1 gnl/MRDRNA2_/MRDRNA2_18191_c0~~gnl/MRDRNA2_/MRDRNA2_18191_c0_seq1.p1  ORF type:complete len:546 (+),score=125.17 gnl/MRDRNA2_/MRDRNA2_18191_c0_seq1:157-1794(+)